MTNYYVPVQLREPFNFYYIGGRRIARHGLHGNRHMVPPAVALRLIDRGILKLMKPLKLQRLRADVAAAAGAA